MAQASQAGWSWSSHRARSVATPVSVLRAESGLHAAQERVLQGGATSAPLTLHKKQQCRLRLSHEEITASPVRLRANHPLEVCSSHLLRCCSALSEMLCLSLLQVHERRRRLPTPTLCGEVHDGSCYYKLLKQPRAR
jgi:hypothetical protein